MIRPPGVTHWRPPNAREYSLLITTSKWWRRPHAAAADQNVSGQRNGLRPAGNTACVERFHDGRSGGLGIAGRIAAPAGPGRLSSNPIELGRGTFAAGTLDVGSETTLVMRQCESLATRRFVALELPVQPDLVVRTGPRAFVTSQPAIARRSRVAGSGALQWPGSDHCVGRRGPTLIAPCRRVGCGRRNASPPCREPRWRSMLGQDRAPPVVLRLPAGATSRRSDIEAETLDPASTWALAERERERSAAGR